MNLFYVPCPDINTAETISAVLLNEKLIGCANIIPGMTSMYWWEGKIEKSSECILILKTTQDAKVLEQRLLELHPYKVPCLLQIPVASINDAYKNWLANSSAST